MLFDELFWPLFTGSSLSCFCSSVWLRVAIVVASAELDTASSLVRRVTGGWKLKFDKKSAYFMHNTGWIGMHVNNNRCKKLPDEHVSSHTKKHENRGTTDKKTPRRGLEPNWFSNSLWSSCSLILTKYCCFLWTFSVSQLPKLELNTGWNVFESMKNVLYVQKISSKWKLASKQFNLFQNFWFQDFLPWSERR